MAREIRFGVGAHHTKGWAFGTGELFRETSQSDLIEAKDDFILGGDDRDTLLSAPLNHLHRRRVVGGDVLLLVWHVAAAKELLSSITPWSG